MSGWIGEHIDYCGYAVLPMAIEQDIVLTVAFNNDSLLRLANTDQRYRLVLLISINVKKLPFYNNV